MRKTIAEEIKSGIQTANSLIVHWDGKILSDIVDHGKIERLPIVITGLNTEQLLGVPKLERGTGEKQTAIIFKTLKEWNLIERIKAMCFDTTSSNTGIVIKG